MRPHPGPGNRTKNCRNTYFPLHKALFHIMVSCNRSPHEAAHFICCNRSMYRQSGDHICRKRDQSPTAGDQILPEIQKNILPDKLISLFLPRSLSSTSFVIYYFFFIAISVGRRISTYSSYITSLRKSTYSQKVNSPSGVRSSKSVS